MTSIPEPLLKIGYNLLFTAGFALSWPYLTYLIWRRQPFWERLGERLGHYPKDLKEGKLDWHCLEEKLTQSGGSYRQ